MVSSRPTVGRAGIQNTFLLAGSRIALAITSVSPLAPLGIKRAEVKGGVVRDDMGEELPKLSPGLDAGPP